MIREDLYTGIHKALRHMLCDLGGETHRNDFTDEAASGVAIRAA